MCISDRQSWLFTGILPSGYCTPIDYDDIRVSDTFIHMFRTLSIGSFFQLYPPGKNKLDTVFRVYRCHKRTSSEV